MFTRKKQKDKKDSDTSS